MTQSKSPNVREHIAKDEDIVDGEPLWVTSHVQLACCGCALTHTIALYKKKGGKLVPNDKPIVLKFFRDELTTEVLREEHGIKVTRKDEK